MTEATAPTSTRQESFFHSLVEASPSALLVIDESTRIVEANSKTEELFGYDRGALLGSPIERLVPERYRTAHPAYVREYLAQPQARPMGAGRELFGLRADGREVPVEIGLSPFSTPEGTFTLASVIDITERRRAEADRAHLAAIVSSSDDAIISKTLGGIVLSWNAAAEQLFGLEASDAIGRSIMQIVPEDQMELEEDLLRRVSAGEHVENFGTQRMRSDGNLIHVALTLSPLRDHRGEIVGASSIVRDITASRQRDLELQRSNAELEQFAYIASHDLQEPLRMVANYVELLADRYKDKLDERAEKYIHFAADGARRMQQLVTDLLAYSRVGSQGRPMVPVDMEKVLANVLRLLGSAISESGAQIEAGGLPTVQGDDIQLGQLMQNLIANAIKFRSEAAPCIRVSAERRGSQWLFSVADDGIGMDMRFADRIFQMFQRLHERDRYQGSGIGLAIAKRIVERHGGLIWVESALGVGTTFRFTLNASPKSSRP